MNELRWILLVIGALLVAGLYLWGIRARWQGRDEPGASRRPAVFLRSTILGVAPTGR